MQYRDDREDLRRINRFFEENRQMKKNEEIIYNNILENITDGLIIVIESHVVHTRKMLEQMGFKGEFGMVAKWARGHHEYLDGSGYPEGLTEEQIPWATRLLTILDIYDSLTADDRPYKPAISSEKAFRILYSMRDEGKLDGEILQAFYDSRAWVREVE